MLKVDLQELWRERGSIKRIQSSETTLVDEKKGEELDELIFGEASKFLIFDRKIVVNISLGLYRSESKSKSRVKGVKCLKGH